MNVINKADLQIIEAVLPTQKEEVENDEYGLKADKNDNNDVDIMGEDDVEIDEDQASALTQNMIPHDDAIFAAVARQYNIDAEQIYGDKALRNYEEDDTVSNVKSVTSS